jgi:hypothetical protein
MYPFFAGSSQKFLLKAGCFCTDGEFRCIELGLHHIYSYVAV